MQPDAAILETTQCLCLAARRAAITPSGKCALAAALPAWRATQRRLTEQIGAPVATSLRLLAGGPCAAPPSPPRPERTRRQRLSKSRPATRRQADRSANDKEMPG
ncbi:MAG: hypothetical protein ACREP0_08205 [Rhodanobacteraceae bacterium]